MAKYSRVQTIRGWKVRYDYESNFVEVLDADGMVFDSTYCSLEDWNNKDKRDKMLRSYVKSIDDSVKGMWL